MNKNYEIFSKQTVGYQNSLKNVSMVINDPYKLKYLKYKSKYQQLKIQKGGAKLGDHTWIIGGDYWGIIVGYNKSNNTYVVLQKKNIHGFKERFLVPENEHSVWTVDNRITPTNPSKKDIKDFIDIQSPLRKDVEWYNPETSSSGAAAAVVSSPEVGEKSKDMPSRPIYDIAVCHSLFPSSGAAAVSSFPSRGMAAPVSSKLTLIELARTNTKFQEFIVKLSKSVDITSDLLFESDTFRDLLTHDAFMEMQQSFGKRGNQEWMRVGIEARKRSTPLDNQSAEARIETVSKTVTRLGMSMYCSNCHEQVNLATKCRVTGMYHMG